MISRKVRIEYAKFSKEIDSQNTSKTTNEKPVSLNPMGFDNALCGLIYPLSDEPKEEAHCKVGLL